MTARLERKVVQIPRDVHTVWHLIAGDDGPRCITKVDARTSTDCECGLYLWVR